MQKKFGALFFLFFWFYGFSQEIQQKTIAFSRDSISLENLNVKNIKLYDYQGNEIDSSRYFFNKKQNKIIFKKEYPKQDSIKISYTQFPNFLTKTYSLFDNKPVVANGVGIKYELEAFQPKPFKPFEGLDTSGSITRGLVVGNNQNTTSNSNLDLQISGKLSEKLSLRASIQDNNIPIQNDGYSQKLDAFDQIFIELFAEKWSIRAGDLFLENRKNRFLNFNKKVQGIATQIHFGNDDHKTDVFISGAVVRGQYAKSTFTGQEGNQGPYKLKGNNGELYVLVISGSERVYVNGILLKRGENNDYVIDYNAGEIRFNSVFPINSEMRIAVEYQYSERNFTRFVTYGGAQHQTEKWNFGGYLYSENDVKNQPLQQNLSPEQVAILQQAGDNSTLMVAPSAYADSYSENKILYKKVTISGIDIYEYSNNATDTLYNVKFTFVGNNLGNYILANNLTIGKIYQYVAPIGGVLQGNYELTVRLYAPSKLQLATFFTKFSNEKTTFDSEVAVSNNDVNLFSTLDDANNKGIATKLGGKQTLFSKKTKLDAFSDFQLIQENFKSIERIFTIEFNRDWNISAISGNQSLLNTGLRWYDSKTFNALYNLEKLDFSNSFSGIKHNFSGNYTTNKWNITTKNSLLKSNASTISSQFLRSQSRAKLTFNKNWAGSGLRHENNAVKDESTQTFIQPTQKFTEMAAFIGRGDSTQVFTELGYMKRWNDSLQSGILKRVNRSDTYYLKSKLIQNQKTNLSVFVNYRHLVFTENKPTENALNSRILYTDSFVKQLFQIASSYETLSGTLAQQDFTYLQVNPGLGVYMWNDYNGNGIQELQEFEVAPYPDLARYVRIFLPNQTFVKTHQNKFSQSVNINPAKWINKTGFLKTLSHFYNQTAFTIDRKIQQNQDNFDLNPFSNSQENLLGLNSSFRNSFYFNRGKQKHSFTYNYIKNNVKSLLNIGALENGTVQNQLQYAHLIKQYWLVNGSFSSGNATSKSDTYSSKNYELKIYSAEPKLTYLLDTNCSFSVFYEYKFKENQINTFDKLQQQKAGLSFNYLSEKAFTVNAGYSLYSNSFTGNAQSPVGFAMLEGLLPGKNSTWNLLLQKKLTQYLDLNINYLGRKSEGIKVIHTGSVQLRAYF